MAQPGVFKSIKPADRSITPFKVYKSWRYDLSTIESGSNLFGAVKPDTSQQSGNVITLESTEQLQDSSSYLINADDRPAGVIYYSLDHLYYKLSNQPSNTFGYSSTNVSKLYNVASVISVNQNTFGESIRPLSVKLSYTASSMTASLRDDGFGSLIDNELPIPISSVVNLSFNDTTYGPNWLNVTSSNTNQYIAENISYNPSFIGYGNSLKLQNDSYVALKESENYNYQPDEDFAISFWFNLTNVLAATGSSDYVYLLSKRTDAIGTYTNSLGYPITDWINKNTDKYSYDIRYNLLTSQVECRRSDGITTLLLSADANLNTNYHLIFQKSGNGIELYLNGVGTGNIADVSNNTYNDCIVFIGSLGRGISSMTGEIFEFNMFDKALSNNEIMQLYQNPINSNQVGRVIYEHGQIIVSDPRPKYNILLFANKIYSLLTSSYLNFTCNALTLEFSSTLTLYEHEYLCRLNSDEFNFTSNPTIRRNNDYNSSVPKSIVSNPYFNPYITTVGLYNDNGQLLAIGKLASAIQKRSNVDTNIVIRFDI
jgi:hypothetical protein